MATTEELAIINLNATQSLEAIRKIISMLSSIAIPPSSRDKTTATSIFLTAIKNEIEPLEKRMLEINIASSSTRS
jgi:hypothetical protein